MDGFTAKLVDAHTYEVRQDARRFELFEKSRALTLGLGKAGEYALEIGPERIWERVQSLAAYLRERLSAIPGVVVHDKGAVLCGIVTFSVKGVESQEVKRQMAEQGITVWVSDRVSTLLYMDKSGLKNALRVSVHYYNTREEIDQLFQYLV